MVPSALLAVHGTIAFGHERKLLDGRSAIGACKTQMPNIEHLAWTPLHVLLLPPPI